MGYAIAQLRKVSGSGTYMQNISVTPTEFKSPNKFISDQMGTGAFLDYGLCLSNTDDYFQQGQTYYLRFIIHRVPEGFYSRRVQGEYERYRMADDLTFTLLLKNKNEQDEEKIAPQIIDSFTIKSLTDYKTDLGANTKYYSYTTVFTPSRNCNLLGFRLVRGAYDTLEKPRKWLGPIEGSTYDSETSIDVFDDKGDKNIHIEVQGQRIIYSGENGDIAKLNNIINNSDAGSSKSDTWLKLGFQSRPGVLIVVNQQPIRVGRSGIYEINNGTSITSFMITAPQGSDNKKIDAFLLDYAYNS